MDQKNQIEFLLVIGLYPFPLPDRGLLFLPPKKILLIKIITLSVIDAKCFGK